MASSRFQQGPVASRDTGVRQTGIQSMLTGFILAGGRSSRMGRDKAFLPIGSHTLIELVMQRLRPLVERVVVISHAHNLQRLTRMLSGDAILTDVQPGYGPLMGVYTGLMHTETSWNLFLPCDMPWIERRLIERLVGACHEEAKVIAARHPAEGIQPFPLLCHVKACRTIGALLDRNERSLQALLHQPHTQWVTIEESDLWRCFTNVNTLIDYAKLTDTPVAR